MVEEPNGAGRFVSAVLRPRISIQAGGDIAIANRQHHEAHEYCFIANTVNFPVSCEPVIFRVKIFAAWRRSAFALKAPDMRRSED